MAVPTRDDPKLLSDYGGGWERRHKARPRVGTTYGPGGFKTTSPGGSTFSFGIETEQGKEQIAMLRATNKLKSAEEAPLTRAEKHKDVVRRSIAASEKRRAALKSMYQAEKDAEFAARKQALEEYKAYAEGAPDPKLDVSGEGRAAYFNTAIGKQVTGNLGAHIQASKDKMAAKTKPTSQLREESNVIVGDVFEYRKKKAEGMTRRAEARRTDEEATRPEAPQERASVDAVDTKSGNNVTVLGKTKDGNLMVQDKDTLQKYTASPAQIKPVEKSKIDYDIPV
jgi:hypothetical protein